MKEKLLNLLIHITTVRKQIKGKERIENRKIDFIYGRRGRFRKYTV